MARYGPHVQTELHDILRQRGVRLADQGEVFDYVPAGLPYRHLIHTLPCDGMYDTTPEIVADVLARALTICATDPSVRRVALSALATGYGHLQFEEFVLLADPIFQDRRFESIEDIVLCIEDGTTYDLAREIIQERELSLEIGGRTSGCSEPSQSSGR